MSTACRVNAKSICGTQKQQQATRTPALFGDTRVHVLRRMCSEVTEVMEARGSKTGPGVLKQQTYFYFLPRGKHWALNQFHTLIFDRYSIPHTDTETFAVIVDDETHVEPGALCSAGVLCPKRDKFARVHSAFNM